MTTIKIKDNTKLKLENLKKDGQTYDQLIQSLIQYEPGAKVNDVTEITREKIAFELESFGFDEEMNQKELSHYSVSFFELSQSKVGDSFKAELDFTYPYFIIEEAKIIYKDFTSVFVKVIVQNKSSKSFINDVELLHIHLF